MNYEAKQWKDLAEGLLFDLGFVILGERSLVAKLYHKMGLMDARRALKAAAVKSEPREYIGAILSRREKEQGPALSEAEVDRLWDKYKAKIAQQ